MTEALPPPPDPGLVDESVFRQLMSCFPTGVSVVTATTSDGAPVGLTCSSLTSVCVRPPTLLVCLRRGSATLAALLADRRFGVNLLHGRATEAARAFAGAAPDRFRAVDWKPSGSALPWLFRDAFAFAECRVVQCSDLGDHTVVFGEVATVIQAADSSLVYGHREFRSWAGYVVSPTGESCADVSRHGTERRRGAVPRSGGVTR